MWFDSDTHYNDRLEITGLSCTLGIPRLMAWLCLFAAAGFTAWVLA